MGRMRKEDGLTDKGDKQLPGQVPEEIMKIIEKEPLYENIVNILSIAIILHKVYLRIGKEKEANEAQECIFNLLKDIRPFCESVLENFNIDYKLLVKKYGKELFQ